MQINLTAQRLRRWARLAPFRFHTLNVDGDKTFLNGMSGKGFGLEDIVLGLVFVLNVSA